MKYLCERCNTNFNKKNLLKEHILQQNCENLNNISYEYLIAKLNNLVCKKCLKIFSARQNRWRHEKKCNNNQNNNTNTNENKREKINKDIIKIKDNNKKIDELEKEITKLRNEIEIYKKVINKKITKFNRYITNLVIDKNKQNNFDFKFINELNI